MLSFFRSVIASATRSPSAMVRLSSPGYIIYNILNAGVCHPAITNATCQPATKKTNYQRCPCYLELLRPTFDQIYRIGHQHTMFERTKYEY